MQEQILGEGNIKATFKYADSAFMLAPDLRLVRKITSELSVGLSCTTLLLIMQTVNPNPGKEKKRNWVLILKSPHWPDEHFKVIQRGYKQNKPAHSITLLKSHLADKVFNKHKQFIFVLSFN